MKKREVYTIKELMNGCQKEKRIDSKTLKKAGFLPLAAVPFTHLKHTFAADGLGSALPVTGAATGDIYVKVVHAFDPLVNIIQALAYPVAMIVVLGGALFIMIGNKEKGFAMMQGAGLGYVLVQLTPMVLNILVSAMKSVS